MCITLGFTHLLALYCSPDLRSHSSAIDSNIHCAEKLFNTEFVHTTTVWIRCFNAPHYRDRMLSLFATYPYATIHSDCDVQGKSRAEERKEEMVSVE